MKKLLGVKFDHKLTFDHYVKSLCKRENTKLKTLARFVPYLGLAKKKLFMNSFFATQVNYCPLISIIHNRSNNGHYKLFA